MANNIKEAAKTIKQISAESASVDSYSELENYLLNILASNGTDALKELLLSIPEVGIRVGTDKKLSPYTTQFKTEGLDNNVVIVAYKFEDLTSINVDIENYDLEGVTSSPEHQWFYNKWESLITLDDSQLEQLTGVDKKVYLIGLFESELMNGGVGQYLANTDGEYLIETISCLENIGAKQTAYVLKNISKLKAKNESYDNIWETKSAELDKLTDKIMSYSEDYAGLAANIYR